MKQDRLDGKLRRTKATTTDKVPTDKVTKLKQIEQDWLDARRLDWVLHHRANSKATRKRKRALSPKEPRAATRWRRYRNRKLGSFGAAGPCRKVEVTDDLRARYENPA